jgi:large conductance mechanosensitive channel
MVSIGHMSHLYEQGDGAGCRMQGRGQPVSTMWNEFKAFAFKGSLIDLAIAFVLGTAFAIVVQSLVADIIMPIVGAVVSDKSFADLSFELGGANVTYGNFLTALLYFLIVAWVLFLIIRAINHMKKPEVEVLPNTKECPFCLTAIPEAATRCAACTSQLTA